MTLFFILTIVVISGYFYYQLKIHNKSAKSLVRRPFSSLELSDDELALTLFRHPAITPAERILLDEVNQCQVSIGDIVISTINTDSDNGFTDQKELNIRELFHIEQIDKMVDDKVRRISLTLSTGSTGAKEIYVVCLYLRKGSDRITQRSYLEAVETAIDWCWVFSELLNSVQTGKRIIKPKITAEDIAKADHKTQDNTPLHAQAARIRPLVQASEQLPDHIKRGKSRQEDNDQADSSYTDSYNSHNNNSHLGYDLDKLLELKEQGFLTAEEYSEAKATYLKRQNKE